MKRDLALPRLIGLLLCGASTLLLAAAQPAKPTLAIPPATNILARINQAHPRLLATTEDFAQLKRRLASDSGSANSTSTGSSETSSKSF